MSEKLTRTQQKNLERLGGVNPADAQFSRRQFASQVGGFAAVAGGAVAAGLLVRDRWGMEGVKPPPPVKLKDYSVALEASRPNMVVVRSPTLLAEAYASKDEETQAREDQALKMVKAAMEEMGGANGVRHFITKGDVVVIKPNVAFDKNPDLAATTSAGYPLPPWSSFVSAAGARTGDRLPITRSTTPKVASSRPSVGDAALRRPGPS